MVRNINNPNGAFLNQTGTAPAPTTACCSCCGGFFCSAFACKLGSSLGTVGAAYFGKKPPTAPNPTAPKPATPVTPKSNTTLYWAIGLVTVAIIGGVYYYQTHQAVS